MSFRPLYLADVTDYSSDKKMKYALMRKENLNSVGLHQHSFIEISYVISGMGSETINGKLHTMKPGTLSLLFPYHVHELYSSPENPLSLFNMAVDLDFILGSNADFGLKNLLFSSEDSLPPFLHLEEEDHQKVLSIFEEMLEESNGGKNWSDFIIKSKLVEILVLFNRLHHSSPAEQNSVNDPSGTFWNIVQYVHSHYNENITLDSLEERFNIRTYKISKLFKVRTGKNFHHFLNHIRIQHACSLLTSSDMTVTEIALETGYESYITFSKIFREYIGVSAAKYRKSN